MEYKSRSYELSFRLDNDELHIYLAFAPPNAEPSTSSGVTRPRFNTDFDVGGVWSYDSCCEELCNYLKSHDFSQVHVHLEELTLSGVMFRWLNWAHYI